MLETGTSVLHRSCGSRKEYVGACRFFNNDKVDYQKIVQPMISNTAQHAKGKTVLSIYDTTEISMDNHSGYLEYEDAQLGPTATDNEFGFYAHPSIVIDTAQEALLGVSDVHMWNRRRDKGTKASRKYKQLPIEQKESNRWITCAQRSKEVLKQAAHVIVIADRECDIYEEFIYIPDDHTDVLIRSRDNRVLFDSDKKLYETLAGQVEAGRLSLQMRSSKHHQARQAQIAVKFRTVKIARPQYHSGKSPLPPWVELCAIEAKEIAATVPKGEKPIQWILLSTLSVSTLEEAQQALHYYSLRWQIELVFGTLKTKGLNIEQSQLESGKSLKSMAGMSLVVAIKLCQLRLSRNEVNVPATIVFQPEEIACLKRIELTVEGKTEKQKNPYPSSSMAWAVWVIARLGGWKGYQRESPPGIKTMYEGWKNFIQMYRGWEIALNFSG
jgi:hypothetical protein